MEVESSPSPGGGGKQKKNSPAKKDDSPKKPRHETEEDKHKEIVTLLMQQIEISKKTEERLEETLKVQAEQSQKLDHLSKQLDHTKSQVENMNKDINDNKDKVDMLEAKLLSVSDEITNIKRQRAASPPPPQGRTPFTPTRDTREQQGGTTTPRASTPVSERAKANPATRTPSFNPYFPSPMQSAAQRSPAPSEGSTIAVNTVAVVRCFAEDTRKGEILEFLKGFVSEVAPDSKPEEMYTPFKRCSFGCVKFTSVAEMWNFIQKVNAAKKKNGSVEIRAKPRQSQEERQRDLNMNRFLRTMYRSSNPPPKDEVDADYRLGKVWVGRFLVAENLKIGQTATVHEQELKLAMPNMDFPVFLVDPKKIMEGNE